MIREKSPIADPESILVCLNRKFGLNTTEKEAFNYEGPQVVMRYTIFNVVNTYNRSAEIDGLTAESSFKLSRIGGNILGLLK